ncbi:transcription initiation factor IIB [Exophiala xenobiotica]|nr:transcription initiation factor IIB [Exophiala xenobiotica]
MAATVAGVETHLPDAPAWHENLNMHLICPDCRQVPPQLVEENADIICANCGMVLAERLVSYESEWRTFNSDEGKGDDPNRVGEADNELYLTNNAGTMIGGGGPNVSKETRRLKKAQAMQLENKAERALQGAYAQIEAWGEKAKLTAPVKAAAKSYYKRVFEANALRGKQLDSILAGCVFIACRQLKVPRTFNEIFGMTSVPKKEIGRVYKQLQNFLSKVAQDKITEVESTGGIVNSTAEFRATQSTKPEDLCGRYCNMVGLNFRVQTIAEGLAKKIPTIEGLAGRSPLSNAAACTFFASWLIGFGKPSKQISEVAGVSDATIKHAYRYLLQDKERLVDKEWLGQQPMPLGGFGKLENLPGA